jgi:ubiquinone/menaquinone biosynthesis C-methylase UbiE
MRAEQPKLYTELAGWWQLVSPTEDYADEAAFFGELFQAENAKTVLELGSGGGNVVWFLKKHFTLTLIDISGMMLAESKKQNPEIEHIEGDMRVLRLGRMFDGVLIHDAIMYMTSEEDLRAALVTAYEHCKPGGVVVLAPDWVAETPWWCAASLLLGAPARPARPTIPSRYRLYSSYPPCRELYDHNHSKNKR